MIIRFVSTVLGTFTCIFIVLAVYSFINAPIRPQVISGAASCRVCTDVITENVKDTSVAWKYLTAAAVTSLTLTGLAFIIRQRRSNAKSLKPNLMVVDIFGLQVALVYVFHIIPWMLGGNWRIHKDTASIIDSRITPLLIIAVVLAGYSWHARRRPSKLVIATLFLLILFSSIWHLGIRVYP